MIMPIKVKKDTNSFYDLIRILSIGMTIIVSGILVASSRLYFSYINGVIDLGKYHGIIGIGLLAAGSVYLFVALKHLLEEAEGDV
jgi:hypothetical protein